MLSSVEQAFVGRDEKRAPLKTPAWKAKLRRVTRGCELLITGQENSQPQGGSGYGLVVGIGFVGSVLWLWLINNNYSPKWRWLVVVNLPSRG